MTSSKFLRILPLFLSAIVSFIDYVSGSNVIMSDQQKKINHWAILVAGSKDYDNYRHQANTCHAYYLLKKNGFSENRIIHMAYDDIAHHKKNPFKGKVFNKPSPLGQGMDVYDGCKIDYRGEDASPDNLFHILRGEEVATGPVLQSDEDSRIFFYFADHGAPGLVRMPSKKGVIYADQLHQTLLYMYKNSMYKELVIYFEACESGSMFENILENDINVYAVTAANSEEVSWGTYCGPFHNWVHHKSLATCLGDLFSVNCLENIDNIILRDEKRIDHINLRGDLSFVPLKNETFQEQFEIVKEETFPRSHVMQYGQMSITGEPIWDFFSLSSLVQMNRDTIASDEKINNTKQNKWWLSMKSIMSSSSSTTERKRRSMMQHETNNNDDKIVSSVNSRDIRLQNLYSNIILNPFSEDAYREYNLELEVRTKVDKVMNLLFETETAVVHDEYPNRRRIDFNCYRELIQSYQDSMCDDLTDYSMKYLKFFATKCDANKKKKVKLSSSIKVIKDRISHLCSSSS